MTDRLYEALVTVDEEFRGYQEFLTTKNVAMISVCLARLWEIKARVETDKKQSPNSLPYY